MQSDHRFTFSRAAASWCSMGSVGMTQANRAKLRGEAEGKEGKRRGGGGVERKRGKEGWNKGRRG